MIRSSCIPAYLYLTILLTLAIPYQVLAAPSYIVGADASGSIGSGTDSAALQSSIASGNYLYVAGAGGATACSNTPGSAIGCELKVFNISNPASPTYIAGADSSGSSGSGTSATGLSQVFISGNYLYVTLAAGNGTACSNTAGSGLGCELKIFDVSTPNSPTYIAGIDSSGLVGSGTGNNPATGIPFVSNNYLYMPTNASSTACSNTPGVANGCELKIYDVSNPAAPTYVAGIDGTGRIGAGIGNSVAGSVVFVSGNYAYLATTGSSGGCSNSSGGATGCEVQIYDVSDPTAPVYKGGIDTSGSINSGSSSTGVIGMFITGNYLYIVTSGNATACSNTAGSAIGCEFKIFDVSDPLNPTYIAGADASGSAGSGTDNSSFNKLYVSGGYAYIAKAASATACSNSAGSAIGCELQVYNVSNPLSPTYYGGADASGSTGSGTDSSAFNGIFVSGSYAFISKAASSTACSNSAGSASGCELQIYDTPSDASCSLSANPSSILAGATSQLSWTTSLASSGSIDNSVGSVSPIAAGSTIVAPTISTTFTLTVTGGAGGTCNATVTVSAPRILRLPGHIRLKGGMRLR